MTLPDWTGLHWDLIGWDDQGQGDHCSMVSGQGGSGGPGDPGDPGGPSRPGGLGGPGGPGGQDDQPRSNAFRKYMVFVV